MYNVSTKNQVYILMFLYIVSIFLIYIAYLIRKNKIYNKAINKYNQKCMLYNKSKIAQKFTKHRSIHYYLYNLDNVDKYDDNSKKIILYKTKYCVVTFWSVSHIMLYLLIGFFCPSLFIPSFVSGVIWEGLEKKFFQCHDIIDIFYNSFGFAIGYLLNKLYFNNFGSNVKIATVIVILIVLLLILEFLNQIEDFSNKITDEEYTTDTIIYNDIDINELNTISDDMINKNIENK
jgi:hypothetical protein